jgi:cbb3-type cytochrome oxidase cytochrome c subunit
MAGKIVIEGRDVYVRMGPKNNLKSQTVRICKQPGKRDDKEIVYRITGEYMLDRKELELLVRQFKSIAELGIWLEFYRNAK